MRNQQIVTPSTTAQTTYTPTSGIRIEDGPDTIIIRVDGPANLPWVRQLAFAALTACADLTPDRDGLTTARQASA
jgi:hypothetical protein